MKMKALPLLLLLLSSTTPLTADDSSCGVLGWGDRDGVTALAASSESLLWIGGSRRVEAWEIVDARRPRMIARIDGGATALASSGDLALALDGSHIRVLGREGERSAAESDHALIAAHGNSFVTAGGRTLTLWRLEGPRPVPLHSVETPYVADAIAFDEAQAVIAAAGKGIAAFSVAADRLGEPRTAGVAARDLEFVGNILWAAAGASGLIPVDARTLQAQAGSAIDTGVGNFTRIEAAGDRLVVGDATGHIRWYQTDGARAHQIGSAAGEAHHLAPAGERLFASGMRSTRFREPIHDDVRVRVLSFDSAGVHEQGVIRGRPAALNGAAVLGELLYVADPPVLRVLQISPGGLQEIAAVDYGDTSDRVRIDGGRLLVYGRGDVHLLDLADPRHPGYLGVFRALGTSPNDVAMAGEYLLEVNKGSGFHVLDISDPTQPRQIGGMINDGFGAFHRVAALEGTAYGASSSSVVKVIDLTDMSKLIDPYSAPYQAILRHDDVIDLETIEGDVPTLLVADAGAVHVYSLEDPLDPLHRSVISTGPIQSMTRIHGERRVVVSLTDGTVAEIDVSSAGAPVTSVIGVAPGSTQVNAAGDWAVAATGSSIRLLARNGTGEELPPPQVERALDGSVLVRWSRSDDWIVELSDNSSFGEFRALSATGNAVVVRPNDAEQWARARVSGCPAVSPAVAIPAALPAVVPGSRTLRLIGVPGENVSGSIRLFNAGAAGTAPSIAGGESLTLTLDAEVIPAGGSAELRIAGAIPAAAEEHVVFVGDTRVRVLLQPVQVREVGSVPQDALLIPGVGSTPGARGTNWRSNADLLCRGAQPCELELIWMQHSPLKAVSITLASGEGIVLRDVARLFGATGSGALAVRGDLDAGAVTWNDSPAGFFGQRIEAINLARIGTSRKVLPAIVANDRFRTNIGLAAPFSDASARILLLDEEGIERNRLNVFVPRHGVLSVPVPAADHEMSAIIEGDDLVVWGSRVDQHTGDGTFISSSSVRHQAERIAPGAWRLRVDLAGTTPGVGGALWQSDTVLTSLSDEPSEVHLTWLPLEGSSESATLQLAAHGSGSPLKALDPAEGLGSILLESSVPVALWSRAWLATDPAGTFGQYLPAAAEAGSLPQMEERKARRILFPLTANEAFRTNLFIAEREGIRSIALVEVRAADGTLLHARHLQLEGWQGLMEGSFLRRWGFEGMEDLQVRIHSEGTLRALASVVSNRTGDGVTIAE